MFGQASWMIQTATGAHAPFAACAQLRDWGIQQEWSLEMTLWNARAITYSWIFCCIICFSQLTCLFILSSPTWSGISFFLVILRIFLIEGYSCLVFETGFPISKSKTIHAKNAHMSSAPANNKKVAGSFVKLSQFHQILIDMAVTKTKRATKCFFLKNWNNGSMTQNHSNTATTLKT